MKLNKYTVDNREFLATEKALESADNWRMAFPKVYGNLPAHVAKSFAKRDFDHKICVSTENGQ